MNLDELKARGLTVTLDGDNLKLAADHELPAELIEQISDEKQGIIEQLKTQRLCAALIRLECGEAAAIRLYSNTCGGQFLIFRDDNISDCITVNCPKFTLAELRQLIGSSSEQIKVVYLIKQELGATVENSDTQKALTSLAGKLTRRDCAKSVTSEYVGQSEARNHGGK